MVGLGYGGEALVEIAGEIRIDNGGGGFGQVVLLIGRLRQEGEGFVGGDGDFLARRPGSLPMQRRRNSPLSNCAA